MKRVFQEICLVMLSGGTVMAKDQQVRIGAIEFFGYTGIDVAPIRAALPFNEGATFSLAAMDDVRRQIKQAIQHATGFEPHKAVFILISLTASRDRRLLAQLRSYAIDSLMEIAKWKDLGYAQSAGIILARIAGLEEPRLDRLGRKELQTIVDPFGNASR